MKIREPRLFAPLRTVRDLAMSLRSFKAGPLYVFFVESRAIRCIYGSQGKIVPARGPPNFGALAFWRSLC